MKNLLYWWMSELPVKFIKSGRLSHPYAVCLAFDGDDRELKVIETTNGAYKELLLYHRILTAQPQEVAEFYIMQKQYGMSYKFSSILERRFPDEKIFTVIRSFSENQLDPGFILNICLKIGKFLFRGARKLLHR